MHSNSKPIPESASVASADLTSLHSATTTCLNINAGNAIGRPLLPPRHHAWTHSLQSSPLSPWLCQRPLAPLFLMLTPPKSLPSSALTLTMPLLWTVAQENHIHLQAMQEGNQDETPCGLQRAQWWVHAVPLWVFFVCVCVCVCKECFSNHTQYMDAQHR